MSRHWFSQWTKPWKTVMLYFGSISNRNNGCKKTFGKLLNYCGSWEKYSLLLWTLSLVWLTVQQKLSEIKSNTAAKPNLNECTHVTKKISVMYLTFHLVRRTRQSKKSPQKIGVNVLFYHWMFRFWLFFKVKRVWY